MLSGAANTKAKTMTSKTKLAAKAPAAASEVASVEVKTAASATMVAAAETEAAAKAPPANPLPTVTWTATDMLARMAEAVTATQGAMETITKYATLAIMRGAEGKAITVAIKTAAAERGTSDSYAGRVAVEAKRLAKFVVTDDERRALDGSTADEALNVLSAIVDRFNTAPKTETSEGGERLPWRTMYDRLAALDPEAIARKAKKEAEEAEAAKAAEEAEAAKARGERTEAEKAADADALANILLILPEVDDAGLNELLVAIYRIQSIREAKTDTGRDETPVLAQKAG